MVEITYDREDKKPSDGIYKVDLADDMGMKPFDVWYGSVGTTNLREANHTPKNSNIDATKKVTG